MKIPPVVIPVAVLLAILAGLYSARLFEAPSWTEEFPGGAEGKSRIVATVMQVRGLRCVDTARTMTGQLAEASGVSRCVCYASRNEARIEYDPEKIDPSGIREAIESPVFDEESGEIRFNQFTVLSIDGEDVDP